MERVAATHRTVLRLAVPMTLANLSTPLLGFVDTAVIGRLGDAALLGGIAAASVVFDCLFWAFGFLRLGTAGLTAQALGAGDAEEQRLILLRALGLAAGLGLAALALQAPIERAAFALLGADSAVTGAAEAYYAVRIWSAPFALLNYAVLGAVIGRGRTDLGLGLQLAINGSNIALNLLLVSGLGLGVRGSAFGTLLAEAGGCAAGLAVLWRLHGGMRRRGAGFGWKRLLDREALGRLLGVNRDILIRSAALVFAFAFFSAQGARHGAVVLAANAVLMNLFLCTAYFLDGFATAAEQMCGQSLGARDERGFRRTVRLTAGWCVGFALAATAAAFEGGGWFVDAVSTNAAVRAAARAFLPFAALTPLCGAVAFEFDGVFTGATWTRDMRNLMLAALGIFGGLFLLTRGMGNAGLWGSLLGFLLARGALQAWRYPELRRRAFPAEAGVVP
ncbi:MAG: MATE family efflux transporter [Gluconacetobacter diazotrophicus]|nr:MATE family efflux transporter [Gluconacetobacter diazotrophicus]